MLLTRRTLMALATATTLTPTLAAAEPTELRFGTNWKAQAEHGGFYQALAKGLYKDAGLAVEIVEGGPNVNHRAALAAGKLDLYMGGNLFGSFDFLAAGVPVTAVAAFFQKEPAGFLAHSDSDIEGFDDLKGHPIFLSTANKLTVWPWLQSQFGLQETQLKPYTFNSAPFIADPSSVQQGYVTAEPYAIHAQTGWWPKTFLFADAGYDSYSTLVVARDDLIEAQPDAVQAFVDASILGWVDYLYGDPAPGDRLIKRSNPDMDDGQLAYSRVAMRERGIVDSGDTIEDGIGAMDALRWRSFFERAVAWGTVPADLPISQAFTLDFVNKGVGLDLKADLGS